MKNSLITIIIIITALTFYSCSDEDNIKTEPEKSIEDCLLSIWDLKNHFYINDAYLDLPYTQKIKVDTCSFTFYDNNRSNFVDVSSMIYYFIENIHFTNSYNKEVDFFNGEKEIYNSSDINEHYIEAKIIIESFQEKYQCNLSFIKIRSWYKMSSNKYISEINLEEINLELKNIYGEQKLHFYFDDFIDIFTGANK